MPSAHHDSISGGNTKVHLRLAGPVDAPALKKLDSVIPVDPSRGDLIEHWLRNDQVMVAEIQGEAVGYGVFNRSFFHRPHVEMLMIHPDFRGRRIGEVILRGLEELCDGSRLYATTNQSNHRMQRLFQRLGYRPGGYIHELDRGDPELVFVKDIGWMGPKT
jgi:GNAT superfamily N-acetyltransferase